MNNNNLKIVSIVLVLFMMFSFSVFGQDIENEVNVSYDRLSGKITVSGNAPLAVNLDEPVRLLILEPKTNIDDFKAGKLTFTSVGVHVDETAILEDKTFAFSNVTFPDNMALGDYIVLVAIENELYETKFSYATEKQTIDELKNAESKDEFLELVEKYNDVYGLETDDSSDFGKLSEKGKDSVISNMLNAKLESKEDIKETFDMFTQLSRISEGPWGVVKEIIEKKSDLLGIDLTDYNKLGDGKTSVCKELIGSKAESKEDFEKIFNKAVSDAKKQEEDESSSKDSSSSKNGSSSGKGSSSSVSMQVNFSEKTPEPTEAPKAEPIEKPSDAFSDIESYDWAKNSILKLYEKGIVNGKSEGIFAPSDSVKRAEAVKMLILTFELGIEKANSSFNDVSKDSWMYPYVSAANELGIVKGLDNETFAPDAYVSREDFAVMVCRAMTNSEANLDKEPKEKFADDENISEYAKDAVYALKNAGIINGVGDNNFAPKGKLTRAEAAKIMAEFLK